MLPRNRHWAVSFDVYRPRHQLYTGFPLTRGAQTDAFDEKTFTGVDGLNEPWKLPIALAHGSGTFEGRNHNETHGCTKEGANFKGKQLSRHD